MEDVGSASTRPESRKPRPGWPKILATLLRGTLIVLGLCAAGVGIARLVALGQDAGAYVDAPVCTTGNPSPGEDCVRLESGRVADRYEDRNGDSTTYNLAVARESAPDGDAYSVGKAFYDDADVGTYVLLRVWKGEVAEVGYQGHKAKVPHPKWGLAAWLALLVAVGSSVMMLGLVGRDGDGGWIALVLLLPFFFAAWIGGLFLGSVHLPLGVAIALSVGCWLVLLAFGWKLAQE